VNGGGSGRIKGGEREGKGGKKEKERERERGGEKER